MNYEEILSDNNQNLIKVADSNKINYANANPFPHIEFKDFFNNDFLDKILNDFPDLSKKQDSEEYKNINEIKFANNDYEKFPEKIKIFFDFLNSNIFLDFLQKLTSINEKLISDPELNGGGLHEIKALISCNPPPFNSGSLINFSLIEVNFCKKSKKIFEFKKSKKIFIFSGNFS